MSILNTYITGINVEFPVVFKFMIGTGNSLLTMSGGFPVPDMS